MTGATRAASVDTEAPGSEELFVALARVAARSRRAFAAGMAGESWAREAGLRPGCYGALRAVARQQPISQRRVAELTGLDAGDLVAVVDVLEAAGYVERQRDPADRRRNALVITAGGRRALTRFDRVSRAAADEVFSALTPAEARQLERLLRKALDGATG